MDSDIGRLSEVAARGLVHHDRGVRETVALACFATGEKERAHRGSLTNADCAHGGGDICHCIVDREACESVSQNSSGIAVGQVHVPAVTEPPGELM